MDELKNKQEAELLKRAEKQKRPFDLPNDGMSPPDSVADKEAYERPEREMQTSEKNHPPGKE